MKQADLLWEQGQALSRQFNDVYFSRNKGISETAYVFLDQNYLPQRWQGKPYFVIGETGFGTGLNFFSTASRWLQESDKKACLHFISVEKFPLRLADLKQSLSCWPELDPMLSEFIPHYPPAVPGIHHIPLFKHRVILTLMLGDVEDMLSKISASVDAWYLDGFAPEKNPEMWTPTVFEQIARLSQKGTTFSTFTAVGRVRRALAEVGFEVEKVKGYGPKREMLRGVFTKPKAPTIKKPWFALSPSENCNKHAVVIGAGIAGVTTAWALAQRGWQIDLIDQRDEIAKEGSGMPQGIVMPRISLKETTESAFHAAAYLKTLRHLNAFKRDQSDFSWQQKGVLQLASTTRILNQVETGQFHPDFVKPVSPKEASALAGIDIKYKALYFPQAGWLKPRDLCHLLIQNAAGRITLHLNTAVRRLDFEKGQWRLKNEQSQLITSSAIVVLTNAARAMQFKQSHWLPLSVARGQISEIPATQQSQHLRCAICYEGYLLPENEGKHVIGATFIKGDAHTGLRQEEHLKNQAQLVRCFPELFDFKKSEFKGHAALRAITPDRMPLVGPVPDLDFYHKWYHDLQHGKAASNYPKARYLAGLYLNTGHGARGLSTSFLCAELITSQICNAPLPVPDDICQALHPARFLIRDLKKKMNPKII